MANELSEIKKILKQKKLVIGTSDTLKKLRSNKLEKIWLSSNMPSSVKSEILHYSSINGIKVIELGIPNDEFGVLCKKQFSVSVAAVLKGEH